MPSQQRSSRENWMESRTVYNEWTWLTFGSHTVSDVAFWRTCGQNLVASGDNNCVTFYGATRFSIREDWTVPGKRGVSSPAPPEAAIEARTEASGEPIPLMGARGAISPPPPAKKSRALANTPWAAEQALHRQRLNLSEATALGSLSPYFDPDRMAEGGFGHGNESEVFGKRVRWQQVALGISVGVPIDEWDDAIHVKSDAFVPYGDGDVSSRGLEARGDCGASPDELETCHSHWALAEREEHEKRWDYARCRSLLTCVRDTVGGGLVKLGHGWRQTVECADRIKAVQSTLYDYVRQYPATCYLVTLGAGGAVGYAFGQIGSGGGATAQDNDELARCSDNTQVNAFVEGILDAANAGDENAARADITLGNGHTLVLYGRVYPIDAVPPTDLCPA
ncbi:uncharacterized protein B0H64DRAFT_431743 [Chaetomium fimeti]|uniref:Uncharacterized protein n=1 Tax=Chaetomium fimeti TaxID=1854472 RepID=A0AAE0HJW5_9PEZI|nr:hypothetical protein B0H64DRAFT_431743 [Chaetomium fimeti]